MGEATPDSGMTPTASRWACSMGHDKEMKHRNKYKRASKEAQKERRLERTCLWKRGFLTEEAATQKGMRTYLCPYCKLWHRTRNKAGY